VDSDELYSGWRELKVPTEAIEEFYANKSIQLPLSVQCFPNEFLLLVDEQNERHTALARHKQGRAIALKVSKNKPIWGLTARNMEQLFALELLMDDDIKLVTLSGHAGTGKSVISLAAGLSKVTDDSSYGKMIIARPVIPLKNSDIGFLPGTIEEKMEPWIKPLKDGIEFLMRLSSQDKRNGRSADELFDQGFVEIVPLAYVRGRSIPNEFFLIDECFPGDVTVTTDVGPMSFSALHDMWSAGAKLPMALSYNEDTGGHEYKQILNAPCKGEKSTIVVTTTVGTFECTQNHRFLTKRGWISAGDLTSSDLLLSTEGMISREFCAKFVSSVPGRDNVSVFDIEVEDNHNFVLSETTVVAHNCQNCSPHEIKTIVTRAGDGTKVVLTGDPAQIDAPYLDEHTNGLVYVVDRFKDSPLAGHIKLSKGERSELAEQAAKRL
jgi:predicted ribonuclease YlaK